jgi:AcrR family transcriptional regulator
MGRWEAGADLRLREAALQMFRKFGFDQVTVAQIAETAGVTERTFFRHFPTKEDVIFSQADSIIEELAIAMQNAEANASPSQLLLSAMTRLAELFEPNRSALRIRDEIIRSVPALRERELLKQHHIATATIDELTVRHIPTEQAAVLAGVGMVVFQVAYKSWLTDRARVSLSARIEKALQLVTNDLCT